jgi:LmbE family N-acetylglucosaminyl deacetylase
MPQRGEVVLHVSPHPDDETLGCGPTLAALRRAGWRVVNLACGLGRAADRVRRESELGEALRRWGFEGEVVDPPVGISATDDLDGARVRLTRQVALAVDRLRPAVVVSPQVHDRHHGHEVVGRAVLGALAGRVPGPVWWMWGLWADLARPTLYVPFGQELLDRQLHALAAHAGEVTRNDYARLATAQAASRAVLGAERVFGYGAARCSPEPYADLLTELRYVGDHWRLGVPRVLDPARPLGSLCLQDERAGGDVGSWLRARSQGPWGPAPA